MQNNTRQEKKQLQYGKNILKYLSEKENRKMKSLFFCKVSELVVKQHLQNLITASRIAAFSKISFLPIFKSLVNDFSFLFLS